MPKVTPDAIVQRLRAATIETMDTKSVQEQLLSGGSIVVGPERRSVEYLKRYIDTEIEKNGAPIRAAGISME